jgi:hypothetical protein
MYASKRIADTYLSQHDVTTENSNIQKLCGLAVTNHTYLRGFSFFL